MALTRITSWLRQSSKKQLKQPRNQRPVKRARLGVEVLEDRSVPAIVTWTGAAGDGLWSSSGNWNGGVPQAGDDLVFSSLVSTQNINNNLAVGTQFRTLTFHGNNYTLNGALILLSGSGTGLDGITAYNSTGTNVINIAIGLTGDQTWSLKPVNNGDSPVLQFNRAISMGSSDLTLDGTGRIYFTGGATIDGTGNITKNGIGSTWMHADNSFFHGQITLNQGLFSTNQQGSLGSLLGTTIVNNGATLHLWGGTYTEQIQASGAGHGGMGALFAYESINFNGSLTATGNITIGVRHDREFFFNQSQVGGTINQSGGSWSLTKEDQGLLRIDSACNLTGSTIVNGGRLLLAFNGTLASPTVIVRGGGWIDLNDTVGGTGIGIVDRMVNANLTLNTGSLLVTGRNGASSTQTLNNITLAGGHNNIVMNTSGTAASTFLRLQANSLIRNDGATIEFDSTNIQLGTFNATQGNRITFTTNPLTGSLTPGAAMPILDYSVVTTLNNGGDVVDVATYVPVAVVGPPAVHGIVPMQLASTAGVTPAVLTLPAVASDLSLATQNTNLVLGGSGATIYTATGNATFNSIVKTNNASVTISMGVFTLNLQSGALMNSNSGTLTIDGNVQFNSLDSLEAFLLGDNAITINGTISVGGSVDGLTVAMNNGVSASFVGGAANVYTVVTRVTSGTLTLAKTANTVAVPGDLVVGDNSGGRYLNAGGILDQVQVNTAGQIAMTSNVTVLGGALLQFNTGAADTHRFNSLTMQAGNADNDDWRLNNNNPNGDARINTGASLLSLNGNVTVLAPMAQANLTAGQAVIDGRLELGTAAGARVFNVADGGAVNDMRIGAVVSGSSIIDLTKTGNGVLQLTNTNNYSGDTLVNGGKVFAQGSQTNSPFTTAVGTEVNGGIVGTSFVGSSVIGGIIRPGAPASAYGFTGSPNAWNFTRGALQVNGFTNLLGSSQVILEVANLVTPITDYDRFIVNGALNISVGATLVLDLNGLFTAGTINPLNAAVTYSSVTGTFSNVVLINNHLGMVANLNYLAGALAISFGFSTTTALASSDIDNATIVGDPVTFTATVTGLTPSAGVPTGSVQFKDGLALLGAPVPLNSSGVAQLTTSALAAGSHSITAQYLGSGNFVTSTSSSILHDVSTYGTTTTLGSSDLDNATLYGGLVTFTATVANTSAGPTPTGSVQFFDGVNPIGAPVGLNGSGVAQLSISTLAAGSHSITASYLGAPAFDPSGSAPPIVHNVGDVLIAAGNSGPGTLEVYNSVTNALVTTISAFAGTSHVEVAVGDINGDGILDVVASQKGEIRSFNGATSFSPFSGSLTSFKPFGNKYKGIVYLAVGDMNNDIGDDIVAGRGSGKSQVRVFSTDGGIATQSASFNAFPGTSGARVAVGQLGLGGDEEIVVTPGKGRTAQLRVYTATGAILVTGANVYGNFKGGAFVSVGDLNGDNIDDVVVSAEKDIHDVLVFDGTDLSLPAFNFQAFGPIGGAVRTTVTDADGDGDLDIAAVMGKVDSDVVFFELDGTPIPPSLASAFFSTGMSLAAGGL